MRLARTAGSRPGLPWLLTLLALGGALLLVSLPAEARVGGGQSFGGGGSGSGGGGSVDGDLIWFLVWLCLEHPAIGIPVALVVVGVVVVKHWSQSGGRADRPWSSHHEHSAVVRRAPPKARLDLSALREDDPNFSVPLLLDYAQLVYARVQDLRAGGRPEALRALTAPQVGAQVVRSGDGLDAVGDVIFGATRIEWLRASGGHHKLAVRFTTNLTELRGGRDQHLLREERWVFHRAQGVLSPGPERMRALGCASCGSTDEPRTDGTCPACDTPRTGGRSQWEVGAIEVLSSRALSRPEVHLGGGVEPGTRSPTVKHPDLPARKRAFAARHPDFDWSAFDRRVRHVFGELQAAWSSQTWERARPYETDALFDVHRFWMERYRQFGLANRLDDVQVLKMEVAELDLDAWFESVTVRVWARMRDWTEQTADGQVVGGSKTEPRTFSEYWTFLRVVGADQRGVEADEKHCPSCGAPLDRVGMSGVCGYCDSKITGGDYDWVLSRIEQDDVYGQ